MVGATTQLSMQGPGLTEGLPQYFIPIIQDILQTDNHVIILGMTRSGKTLFSELIRDYLVIKKSKKVYLTTSYNTTRLTMTDALTQYGYTGLAPYDEIEMGELHPDIPLTPAGIERLKNTDVLIIDDAHLVSYEFFEYLDQLARLHRQNNEHMGGIRLILTCDPFNMEPVWKDEEMTSFYENAVFLGRFKRFKFPDPSFQGQELYGNWVKNARNGRAPPDLVTQRTRTSDQQMNNIVKANRKNKFLFQTNAEVDAKNDEIIQSLPGPVYEFEAEDTREGVALNVFNKKHSAKEKLKLKVGCFVRFIARHEHFLYRNGMTGYVTKVEKNGDEEMIQVRLDESGNFVTLTKNDIVEFHRGVNQDLIRNQYPLVVDYARTIRLSRGCHFDNVVIGFGDQTLLRHGEWYQAISAATRSNGIFLVGFRPAAIPPVKPSASHFWDAQIESNEYKSMFVTVNRLDIQPAHATIAYTHE